MNLKFLGIGSAFQTSLYNNCAYFIEDNQLFLIDCGETAFEQLKEQEDSSFSIWYSMLILLFFFHSDPHFGMTALDCFVLDWIYFDVRQARILISRKRQPFRIKSFEY